MNFISCADEKRHMFTTPLTFTYSNGVLTMIIFNTKLLTLNNNEEFIQI